VKEKTESVLEVAALWTVSICLLSLCASLLIVGLGIQGLIGTKLLAIGFMGECLALMIIRTDRGTHG
jgi:hypothetical protein